MAVVLFGHALSESWSTKPWLPLIALVV